MNGHELYLHLEKMVSPGPGCVMFMASKQNLDKNINTVAERLQYNTTLFLKLQNDNPKPEIDKAGCSLRQRKAEFSPPFFRLDVSNLIKCFPIEVPRL